MITLCNFLVFGFQDTERCDKVRSEKQRATIMQSGTKGMKGRRGVRESIA